MKNYKDLMIGVGTYIVWKMYLPIRTLPLVSVSYTQEFKGNKRFLWNHFESSI